MLLNKLQDVTHEYLTKLGDLKNNINEINAEFKKTYSKVIDDARPGFERDLNWGGYLNNLLKEILEVLILVSTFSLVRVSFFKEPSKSLAAVDEARQWLVNVHGQ